MKNILTLEAFADWCVRQPNDYYYYENSTNCACAQYARSIGLYDAWDTFMSERYRNPRIGSFWEVADGYAREHPRFLHDLAERIRGAQT